MSEEPVSVSVVVPVHDEADSIPELVRRVRAVLDERGLRWELVVVDDGSKDGTADLLRRLSTAEPALRAYRHPRRRGQTAALRSGMALARGRILVTLDGDLQNPPEEIPRLLDALEEGADIVSGWRRRRRDAWLTRRLPSAAANAWIRRLTGVPVHDHGCGLKAYRREALAGLRPYGDHHRLLAAVGALQGARVREVEVRHEPRRSGRSKYGVGRVLRVAADALSIHLLLRHGHRPSGWFLKSALVFLAGAAWAAAWAGWSAAQGAGRPSVVGAGAAFLLGVCGMSLAAFGWFAELLLRLEPFRLQRERSPLRDGGESGRRARGGAARERRGTTWERRATARERGGRPGPEVVS